MAISLEELEAVAVPLLFCAIGVLWFLFAPRMSNRTFGGWILLLELMLGEERLKQERIKQKVARLREMDRSMLLWGHRLCGILLSIEGIRSIAKILLSG